MSEHFDQPFFVPYKMAKRLGWTRAGYLPALEPRIEVPEIANKEPEWSRRQWAIVLSLQDEVRGFRERFYKGLNEIKQKSTPKEKRKYVIKE